ncbi:MAG TPA: class I SAM-dependent methyltransferase [Candidatus Avipropionibacterium avicola]|uniref:Class I SAM-dependent methyltransferase n=1 Tax=Candidatus Avipropionibacterium avicola TaxID=2840701 RepID=A0A9D1GUU4_9ACTN|nr:class I SAM-dependent methyltransferase [Candidatus Avipropionibacterium avicola]
MEETGQPDGWDFSVLEGRVSETPLPWNLERICREALRLSRHVLDMGTGGGEHLKRFANQLPTDTVATEGWQPNIPVAQQALEPLGITVVPYDPDTDRQMPFPDNRFDLILNRHESFDAQEVARVLAPGGVFITQQVGGTELGELHQVTGKRPDHPEVTLRNFSRQLTDADLEIVDDGEDRGWYEFVDVAALVAYLQFVPWDVPHDFSVERYRGALWELHRRGPMYGEPLRLTKIRFWLRARKPIM